MTRDVLTAGLGAVLVAAVATGFVPVVATKLIVRLYPREHPRRAELVAELLAVPFAERPSWVFQCLALGLTEGLPLRLRSWRNRPRTARRVLLAPTAVRALDVAGAVLSLVVAAPVMAVVAFAIRAESPGPVLFRSVRTGRGGQPFYVFKFRTMHTAPADGPSLQPFFFDLESSGPKVTRVGRVLRRLSLDELPQLVNVAKGDMSLVGPRPGFPWERDGDAGPQAAIRRVRPGLTGDWQLSRDASEDGYWLLNAQQADRTSVRHYVTVLCRTVLVVVVRPVAGRLAEFVCRAVRAAAWRRH